ncbi:hypothetical protein [Mesorhizobium sp. KR9-304]|uniref:hypothetical protein n=1 Tax=Mesorhizobium sp. KR9-304 TaxID=3156614 RepID=UPI0032B50A86
MTLSSRPAPAPRKPASGVAGSILDTIGNTPTVRINKLAPDGIAADWLTSAWGQNAAIYDTSPAAAVAEEISTKWLLDLVALRFPSLPPRLRSTDSSTQQLSCRGRGNQSTRL